MKRYMRKSNAVPCERSKDGTRTGYLRVDEMDLKGEQAE